MGAVRCARECILDKHVVTNARALLVEQEVGRRLAHRLAQRRETRLQPAQRRAHGAARVVDEVPFPHKLDKAVVDTSHKGQMEAHVVADHERHAAARDGREEARGGGRVSLRSEADVGAQHAPRKLQLRRARIGRRVLARLRSRRRPIGTRPRHVDDPRGGQRAQAREVAAQVRRGAERALEEDGARRRGGARVRRPRHALLVAEGRGH
eukprot:4407618-Prymnesium_polylepis.1